MTDYTTNRYGFVYNPATPTFALGIWLPDTDVTNLWLNQAVSPGVDEYTPVGNRILTNYEITLDVDGLATIEMLAGAPLISGQDYYFFRSIDPLQVQNIDPGMAITTTDFNFPRLLDYVVWYDYSTLIFPFILRQFPGAPRSFLGDEPNNWFPEIPPPADMDGRYSTISVDNDRNIITVPLVDSGSAADLETRLAENSDAASSGGTLVGVASTFVGHTASTIQSLITLLSETAPTGGGNAPAAYLYAWDVGISTPAASSIQTIFENIQLGVNFPVGYKVCATDTRAFTSPNQYAGLWIRVKKGETLGSAASGATHANDDFEAMFLAISTLIYDLSEADAATSWAAGEVLTGEYWYNQSATVRQIHASYVYKYSLT